MSASLESKSETQQPPARNGAKLTVHAQGLLFDMDGVLISSIGAVERCWRQWCRIYGIPNADSFQVPHGQRAIDLVRMLKPEFNDQQAAEGLRVIEDLEIADTAGLTVLPGAKQLLSQLPSDRWAIVTSCTTRLMLGRLAAAGLPVPERIISGDMVERGKPDPEPYRRGAQLLGFAPADCIVVEDAPSGVWRGHRRRAGGSPTINHQLPTSSRHAVSADNATSIRPPSNP